MNNRLMELAGIPQRKQLLKEVEEKNWIAPSHKGLLHQHLGISSEKDIPRGVLSRELEKLKSITAGGGVLTPSQRTLERELLFALNTSHQEECMTEAGRSYRVSDDGVQNYYGYKNADNSTDSNELEEDMPEDTTGVGGGGVGSDQVSEEEIDLETLIHQLPASQKGNEENPTYGNQLTAEADEQEKPEIKKAKWIDSKTGKERDIDYVSIPKPKKQPEEEPKKSTDENLEATSAGPYEIDAGNYDGDPYSKWNERMRKLEETHPQHYKQLSDLMRKLEEKNEPASDYPEKNPIIKRGEKYIASDEPISTPTKRGGRPSGFKLTQRLEKRPRAEEENTMDESDGKKAYDAAMKRLALKLGEKPTEPSVKDKEFSQTMRPVYKKMDPKSNEEMMEEIAFRSDDAGDRKKTKRIQVQHELEPGWDQDIKVVDKTKKIKPLKPELPDEVDEAGIPFDSEKYGQMKMKKPEPHAIPEPHSSHTAWIRDEPKIPGPKFGVKPTAAPMKTIPFTSTGREYPEGKPLTRKFTDEPDKPKSASSSSEVLEGDEPESGAKYHFSTANPQTGRIQHWYMATRDFPEHDIVKGSSISRERLQRFGIPHEEPRDRVEELMDDAEVTEISTSSGAGAFPSRDAWSDPRQKSSRAIETSKRLGFTLCNIREAILDMKDERKELLDSIRQILQDEYGQTGEGLENETEEVLQRIYDNLIDEGGQRRNKYIKHPQPAMPATE